MCRSRQVILLVFFLLGRLLPAQNIVPDPSFEQIKKKPCTGVNTNGDNIANYVDNWVAPTGGTSDLQATDKAYDSCSVGLVSYNFSARTGQYCGGFYTLSASPARAVAAAGIKPYREYLQIRLSTRMDPSKIYYVELYVSPFDASRQLTTSCYTNNVGCFFSVDSVNRPLDKPGATEPLAYKPQLNESEIMNQPGRWHKISGCFQAKEAYQFLTIGNFFADNETKYVEGNFRALGAYFFIDDVSVIETTLTTLPQVTLSDTTLCPKQVLSIDS